MQRFLHFLIIFMVLFQALQAQERYLEPFTDEVTIQTVTYSSKGGENLDMDIYLPENDPETERATIIYVHGGGFHTGTRNNQGIQEFCRNLATYGYVAVSISYRLTRKNEETAFG